MPCWGLVGINIAFKFQWDLKCIVFTHKKPVGMVLEGNIFQISNLIGMKLKNNFSDRGQYFVGQFFECERCTTGPVTRTCFQSGFRYSKVTRQRVKLYLTSKRKDFKIYTYMGHKLTTLHDFLSPVCYIEKVRVIT